FSSDRSDSHSFSNVQNESGGNGSFTQKQTDVYSVSYYQKTTGNQITNTSGSTTNGPGSSGTFSLSSGDPSGGTSAATAANGGPTGGTGAGAPPASGGSYAPGSSAGPDMASRVAAATGSANDKGQGTTDNASSKGPGGAAPGGIPMAPGGALPPMP